MHQEPKWISTEWSADDLNDQRVKYRVYVGDPKVAIEGEGVFRASTRADGLKRIEISVQGRAPDRVTQLRFWVDESQARWIKRLPSGSPFAYVLEEPEV